MGNSDLCNFLKSKYDYFTGHGVLLNVLVCLLVLPISESDRFLIFRASLTICLIC